MIRRESTPPGYELAAGDWRAGAAWYAVGVLTLANVVGFVDRQILSLLVVPLRRDLAITDTQVSVLMGLSFTVFYTVLGLPIARLADRRSRRAIIGVGIALWSLMTMASALARSYEQLLLARIGVGIGEAALAPAALSLLADMFPRQRLSTAMSVYSLGIFLGSGLAYGIGGWTVGLTEARGLWDIPVLGAIRPWQTVFLMIGAPGLLVALLLATVREPSRTAAQRAHVPLSALARYVRDNARTLVTQSLGFGLSATVNYGIAAWLATFLVRTHGWPVSRAGLLQGALTMTVGVLGVVSGGRVADALVRRGRVDGPLLVGMAGATGMLVCATLYPLVPGAALAVALLVPVNFFAAFPWGAASAAAAEVMPSRLRAQGSALYFIVVSLISGALGPSAVALITDRVFGDPLALRYSLAIVSAAGMLGTLALLAYGRPAYRATVARREATDRHP